MTGGKEQIGRAANKMLLIKISKNKQKVIQGRYTNIQQVLKGAQHH